MGLLLVVACGSSAKTGGDKGNADAAPEAATPDAGDPRGAFASGTRLKAVLAEASDGTSMFLRWWDSVLGVACAFEQVGDTLRCMPQGSGLKLSYVGVDEVFLDAACTRPAHVGDPSFGCNGQALVKRIELACPARGGLYRVGARSQATSVYTVIDGACAPRAALPQGPIFDLQPISPEEFVAASLVAGVPLDGIALVELKAEDGAHGPWALRDAAGAFDCSPQATTLGTRCLPIDHGYSGRGVFADRRCTEEAAVAPNCNDARTSIPFVFDDGGAGITAVRSGGMRLAQTFQRADATDCVTAPAAITPAFAIGAPVPLDRFTAASWQTVASPAGLVQTVGQAGGVSLPRFDRLAASALGGYECTLASTPDGVSRCAPPVEQTGGEYADPECSVPVWGADWPTFSITKTPSAFRCTADGMSLPQVDRVLTGGKPYQGPVYRRLDAGCSLTQGVPNARQPYQIGNTDVTLADLPALRVVVR